MNEGRLPSWVRLSSTGSGSPRRVAQFDEYQRQDPAAGEQQGKHDDVLNPFVSPSDYIDKELVEDFLEDNWLTIYCRQGLWDQALERCESHPHESIPSLAKSDFMEEIWSSFMPIGSEKVTLYEPTPLGILCSSSDLHQVPPETLVALVEALCQQQRHGNVGQDQVSASQKFKGNTPLRQAIRNLVCPPAVIGALLRQSDALDALKQPDEHGVYPFDHLLQRVRKHVSAEMQTDLLRGFLDNAPLKELVQSLSYSPLVRFYSAVGNADGSLQQSWRHQLSVPTLGPAAGKHDAIVWMTRMLLDAMPGLLTVPSLTTRCMPIHAALRNYGNCSALIEALLARPEQVQSMLARNNFGDLPLHVACACGVPLPVLRLVLSRTVQAASGLRDPVLWSTNHAGYTPIDLEWIRHIEAGNGFFSQAVFQPIGVEGIPRPRGRYEDLYDKLLRQAVHQVVTSKTERSRTTENSSQDILGLLLHRIFLIIRATFHDSFSSSPFDLSGDILHQASALFQPRGPSVPEAIMDLLLVQYPEQIEQRDHLGRTPLHHAVHVGAMTLSQVSERKSAAWQRWVQKLLERSSRQVIRTMDARGRYPLHTALDSSSRQNDTVPPPCPQFHTIIIQLASGFPEALQVRDPVSRLFPAVQAASHPLVPLDTVHWLFRRAPGVLW